MKIYGITQILNPDGKFVEPKTGDIYNFGFVACPIRIGEGVHISSHFSAVGKGLLTIDDYVTIAPHVTIYTSYPDLELGGGNKYCVSHHPKVEPVHIGKYTFIGAGAVICAGVKIGNYATIGAQSYVNTDVDDWGIYIGRPAKKVGDRREQ